MTAENPPGLRPEALPDQRRDPLAILELAVERGIDAASIEKLAELAWKQENRNAAREFAEALREFQETVPEILKSATARFATKKGSGYSYNYAPLEVIDRVVKPVLHGLGLSYSWDSTTTEAGLMTVTCTLRHVNGHTEAASFSCPTDSPNPGMSGQQRFGGAMSFARRYSLTAILGLTTTEPDDDGMDPEPITDEQVQELNDLLASLDDSAAEAKFLLYMNVESLEAIRKTEYARALNALKAKGAG